MRELLWSRTTLVFGILLCATVLSYSIGHGFMSHRAEAGALIIAVACVKVRFVALEFMELRTAPAPLRGVAEAFCGLLAVILIVLFLAAP